MTARESGYDGVNFYFGSGEDDCAFAWTPRGVGPGGLIADMITEASGRAPSTTKLLELARSRSEEHTSELQSLMRISYAVFCLKKKTKERIETNIQYRQQ